MAESPKKAEEKGPKPTEPEHVRKLFIGGLSFKTTTETLTKFYSQWGDLTDCVVMKDPKSGRPRGFGFVTYATSAQLEKAQKARPHHIDGRTIEPIRAQPRHCHRLYVAGVKGHVEEEDLRKYFGEYGKIYTVEIAINKKTGEKRGFAFIEFDDYDAVDKIVMQKSHYIRGKRIDVKKALTKEEIEKYGPNGRDGSRDDGPMGGWGGNNFGFDFGGMDGPWNGPPNRGGWNDGPNFNRNFNDFGFDGPSNFNNFGGNNFRGNDWGNDGSNNGGGWGDGPNRNFGNRGGSNSFRDNFDNSQRGDDFGFNGNRGYSSGRNDWGNDSGPVNDSPVKRSWGGDDGPGYNSTGPGRNFNDSSNSNFGGNRGNVGGFDDAPRGRGQASVPSGGNDWGNGSQGGNGGYRSGNGDNWGNDSGNWRGGASGGQGGGNRSRDDWDQDNVGVNSGYRSAGGPMKASGGYSSARPTPYGGGGNSNNSFKPQIAGPTGRRF